MQNAFQFSVESACKICRYSILIIRRVILKVTKNDKKTTTTQNATTDFFLNLTHPNVHDFLKTTFPNFTHPTAHRPSALLQANRKNVLPWPSLSPDLNPIEHIWDVIGQRVRSHVPLNIRDLERFVVEEQNGVAQMTLRNYIASMRSHAKQ